MTTKSYSQRKRNATPDGDSASPPKEGAASGSQSMKSLSGCGCVLIRRENGVVTKIEPCNRHSDEVKELERKLFGDAE